MSKMGIPAKMIRVVKSTLHNSTAILHVEGEQREVLIREGTGQGTTLGPVLCNLFLLPLLLHWEKEWSPYATKLHHIDRDEITDSLIHNFADDTAIITKSRGEAEAVARKIYFCLQDFLIDLHVASPSVECSKSVAVFIPANVDVQEEDDCEPLVIDPIREKKINFVKEFEYLGHIITSNLMDDAHLRSRMGKAAQVFGALRSNVFARREIWNVVKVQVLETMIIPTLLDGAECCAITANTMTEMESLYSRFVRTCLRITPYTQRKYRLTSEVLLRKLGIKPLHYYLDLKMLGYAGHVQRMRPDRLPKIIQNCDLQLPLRSGRKFKTVIDTIQQALQRTGIDPVSWKALAAYRLIGS